MPRSREDREVTYDSLVDEYLSETHRTHPGTGCAVAALSGDISRSDKQTRALVTGEIRDNIKLLEDSNPKDGSERVRVLQGRKQS